MMYVSLIVILLISYIFYSSYNTLVKLEEQTKKSWSNIEVLLKQRFDELNALLEVTEQFAQHEESIFKQVNLARANYGSALKNSEKIHASSDVSLALKGLFALSENYPDLKSNQNFIQLQNSVSRLEENLADRRESYNDAVSIFNSRIRQIPHLIIANLMNMTSFPSFIANHEERRRPSLRMNLNHKKVS